MQASNITITNEQILELYSYIDQEKNKKIQEFLRRQSKDHAQILINSPHPQNLYPHPLLATYKTHSVGMPKIRDSLIAHGADVNFKLSSSGETLLTTLATQLLENGTYEDSQGLTDLLRRKADPNIESEDKLTTLEKLTVIMNKNFNTDNSLTTRFPVISGMLSGFGAKEPNSEKLLKLKNTKN